MCGHKLWFVMSGCLSWEFEVSLAEMLVAKLCSTCWESSLIQLAIKRAPLVSIIVHSNNMTKQSHSSMFTKWEDDV